MIFQVPSRQFNLDERVLIMGVINVTPDSFSDGGRYLNPEDALSQAVRLEAEGADIIDIGAVSTRPQAPIVSEDEELKRILPFLKPIVSNVNIPISVDTTSALVAEKSLKLGAEIINDVSGLKDDELMAQTVSDAGASIILMHRRGHAGTMQSLSQYDDVIHDTKRELSESVEIALSFNIDRSCMLIDPGIGFAKTFEQNLEILRRLSEFQDMGSPILIGTSRKSFIGQILGNEPLERDFGTVASCLYAVERGANVLRVHNVKAMKDALKVVEAIRKNDSVVSRES